MDVWLVVVVCGSFVLDFDILELFLIVYRYVWECCL